MPARYSSARFVGRERELARIATALERAAGGRTTSLLLTASAGLGATRLLGEVEHRLADLDEPFLVIRCSTEASFPGEPYGPVIAGFLPVLTALDDPGLAAVIGPVAEPIARLLPQLQPRLAAAGLLPDRPWIVDPERRQARLLEALLGCIERLSERAPVLVVLEDLHSADFGTRALATFLARITRPGRIAMIATYQPDEVTRDHPLRQDIAAMAEANEPPATLTLDPLGRDALAGLIEGIEEQRPSASQLLLVTERSAGNPLVAEEIVIARRELTGVSLAGPFDQIVMARLADRTPDCRRLLRILALAGGPIRVGELAAATGVKVRDGAVVASRLARGPAPYRGDPPPFDLLASLDEAAAHGYLLGLQPVAETSSAGLEAGQAQPALPAPHDLDRVVRLRHELIARAIAADLLPGQRRRDHVALASALDARPAASVRHWLAIHRTDEASAAALRAAAQAEAVDAPGDALAALEIALQIGEQADDPAKAADASRNRSDASRTGSAGESRSSHLELLKRAAEAAFSVGRTRRAVAYLESALGRLGGRDRAEAGLLHERLGLYRRVDGDHAGGLEAQREAVRLLPAAASVDRARALAGLAQALMLDGAFTEAKARADEAIAMADTLGDEGLPIKSHATCTLGISEAYGGDINKAVDLLQTARSIAENLKRLDAIFRSLANLTTTYELQWRQDDAISTATDGIERATRVGLEAVYGNQLRGNVASSLILVGRWQQARAMSQRGLEWSPAGPAFVDPAISLAAVEVESAADEAAAILLGRLLLELEILPDPQYVVPASRVAASFALWRGDVSDARRAAERGWALTSGSEDWIAVARMAGTLLEVLAAQADEARERRDLAGLADSRTRARAVLDAAEGAVANSGASAEMGSRKDADAWLHTARANLQRIDGIPSPESWEHVAGRWSEIGDPYQEARAKWRGAEAILAQRDGRSARPAASGLLQEAYDAGMRLGATPFVREVMSLADRALVSIRQAPEVSSGKETPVDPDRLTSSSAISAALSPVGPSMHANAFGLSPREKDVLKLIVSGRTNREIGDRLFISQKTVGVHVGNILAKLGVSGRVEAATVALRLGLADIHREA